MGEEDGGVLGLGLHESGDLDDLRGGENALARVGRTIGSGDGPGGGSVREEILQHGSGLSRDVTRHNPVATLVDGHVDNLAVLVDADVRGRRIVGCEVEGVLQGVNLVGVGETLRGGQVQTSGGVRLDGDACVANVEVVKHRVGKSSHSSMSLL